MVSFRADLAGALMRWAAVVTVALGTLGPGMLTRGAEAVAPVERWLEAQTNVQSWSARFVQTRTLKALKEPLTATGRVWFAAPNRFRWELGEPAESVAVRAGETLSVFYPRLKRVEKYPLAEVGRWRDALSLLEAGFPRTAADLRARYQVVSEATEGEACELVLQPRSAAARRLVRQVAVRFDTQTFGLLATELLFADGSRMRNEFREAELNPPTPEALFAPAIPEDFKVVEPLKR